MESIVPSKMTAKRRILTAGVCLIEVSVKKELTANSNSVLAQLL